MSPRPTLDWVLAGEVGARLVRPGPVATPAAARRVVVALTADAVRAQAPVAEVTGLGTDTPVPAARVVDRPGWVRAAAASMGAMTGTAPEPGVRPGLSGRAAGAQAGAVLGLLSGAVLGQYDPFTAGGTLLLVAPNVVAVQRALRVPAADFRRWVCLHEVTHRVQFTANPWLTGYMAEQVATLTATEDGLPLARLVAGLRHREPGAGLVGLLRATQGPEQRAALDAMLALGTLLEGHADHVMDAVGPAVVPSVARIRRGFDARRARPSSPVQRLLRVLLGLDAKIAQYVRGKAFVDHVVERVGMAAFNTVWTGPATVPVAAEIAEPDRWVRRVLG